METVGDFEYYKKDLIGHGAFAVVFKGRNKKKTDFVVAIKSITKKNLSKSQNLLGKEIKILKELTELHHENVVALLDCKETTQHVFLVMEYCNGGDLADYLQAKGTLSEDTIRIFLRQIAGAMKALNAKGIVHRDLKPQNILLCHSGKPNPAPTEIKLKIADFGFARFLQDGVMAATLCGSPMYMAPEVIMSLQYDAKADLWSIGTIVFQCLTGKAPFQAQTPQALKQFYEKNANLVPNIPSGTSAELKDLLFKLLKRNAKDRLEFDFFFNHPFLKLGAKKPTSPVPVPTRQRSFLDDGPTRPAFNLPLSTASPPSPSRSEREQCQVSLVQEENTVVAEKAGTSPGSRCSSDNEDFVLVPANLPTDLTCDGGPQTRKSTDFDSPPLSTTPPGKNQVVIPRSSGPVIYIKNQFSPPRPSSLPVQTNQPQTANANYTSEPIPVPSQKQAYEQIQQSLQESPGHKEKSASPISSSPKRIAEPQLQTATVQCSSQSGELYKTACTSANITSLSPPAVQFTIGTPPNTGRRRSLTQGTPPPITNLQCITPPPHSARCSTTPPNSGSPNRRSGNTPAWSLSTTPTFTGPNTLPTIIGSPVKTPTKFEFPPTVVCNDNLTSPSAPLNAPFCPRTRTLPEMGTIDYTLGLSQTKMNDNFAETSGNFFKKSGSAGKLSEQLLLKAAFGSGYNSNSQLSSESPPNTLIMAFRERSGSLPFSLNREQSIGKFNNAAYYETSPTNSLPYGTSPPNMEGPIMFVAPDLPQETLMEREHNETLAKLNFVLALVDCIIELAKAKATPIAVLTESMMQRECDRYMDQIIFNGEGYRRAEQLVLYMRALQMLTSSLNLAKEEIQAGKLQPSNSVKLVITALNNRFRICFRISKQLSGGVLQAPGVDPNSSTMTADRLIYNHAIEMCQAAALDELFGKPQECFHRYQVAQILLHSLSQQVSNEHDRDTLLKYKDAVEKRLFVLQNQGYIYAYDS